MVTRARSNFADEAGVVHLNFHREVADTMGHRFTVCEMYSSLYYSKLHATERLVTCVLCLGERRHRGIRGP